MKDIFNADTIGRGLNTNIIGKKIIFYESISSTNEIAREKSREGANEGTTIIAGEQVGGRGRFKRHWETPAGNIALSVILYPSIERLPYLIMIAAVGVCRSIEIVTGLKTGIKWPNDILINGKKVCGILIENEIDHEGKVISITGIGINTGLQPADYEEIKTMATSLEKELGQKVSRADITRSLLEELDRLYILQDDQATYEAWRERMITTGQPVTITWKNGSIEGIAEDVDESGALIIRLGDGTLHTVVAGDVTLRK